MPATYIVMCRYEGPVLTLGPMSRQELEKQLDEWTDPDIKANCRMSMASGFPADRQNWRRYSAVVFEVSVVTPVAESVVTKWIIPEGEL